MTKITIKPTRPVVLCILDGWGAREDSESNAIIMADTPHYDQILKNYSGALLKTSGAAVGLPHGQMGNSEVGHMNIGGGRVVKQELPRIDDAIAKNKIKDIENLKISIAALKESGGTCHIMGLLSPGGVHSHQDHITALARLYSNAGIEVAIHAFSDGRDVPPKSVINYINKFKNDIAQMDGVRIATICGRYYAMDRDNRWDRVIKAHNAINLGQGLAADNEINAIEQAYDAGLTDEFIEPTILGNYSGINDGDALIMANFRSDRAREIMATFVDPTFNGFKRTYLPKLISAIGMTKYSDALSAHMQCLFPSEPLKDTLGEIVSNHHLKQLRIAETEKFAHVTFFFNGGKEDLYEGEERILVPSPDVATYDLKPEMSAPQVTDKLVDAITSEKFDMIIVNFANPDMVGHTGIMTAAIKAVETIDDSLGRLCLALQKVGGSMLITADHGNIELMKDPNTGVAHTAHTTNLVPIILVSDEKSELNDGALCDVAPTILSLMDIKQPRAMTGKSLIQRGS